MKKQHCCPWWMNYLMSNPLRMLMHSPNKMFGHLVEPGMTVLDAGCGMGVFTMSLAKMAGEDGHVVAVDIDGRNLKALARKARRKGLEQRITTVACDMGELPLELRFDFALAAYSVHEVPEFPRFFQRLNLLLKPGAKFLLLEPTDHISKEDYERELELATEAGLQLVERPTVRSSLAALLQKAD